MYVILFATIDSFSVFHLTKYNIIITTSDEMNRIKDGGLIYDVLMVYEFIMYDCQDHVT